MATGKRETMNARGLELQSLLKPVEVERLAIQSISRDIQGGSSSKNTYLVFGV